MINWIKRWKFLVLIVITGALYLSLGDGWQVYAQTLENIADWCETAHNRYGFGLMQDGKGEASGTENGALVDGEEGEPADGGMSNGGISDEGMSDGTMLNGAVSDEGYSETVNGTVSGGDGAVNYDPEFVSVEEDYFADALFIGDSRTVGMFEYGGLENTAQFYASTGLTIFRLFQEKEWKDSGVDAKQTLEEVLREQSFSKIYLMVGINEMGTGTVEKFAQTYGEAVAHLQELQPDAVIYLQSIIKVTEKRSGLGDYITNEGIAERNAEIAKLADGQRVFYLDVNEAVCDESGGMIPDYTYDGVHLKAMYIPLWKEYLKNHAITVQ